jgi:hypothetical protein
MKGERVDPFSFFSLIFFFFYRLSIENGLSPLSAKRTMTTTVTKVLVHLSPLFFPSRKWIEAMPSLCIAGGKLKGKFVWTLSLGVLPPGGKEGAYSFIFFFHALRGGRGSKIEAKSEKGSLSDADATWRRVLSPTF